MMVLKTALERRPAEENQVISMAREIYSSMYGMDRQPTKHSHLRKGIKKGPSAQGEKSEAHFLRPGFSSHGLECTVVV